MSPCRYFLNSFLPMILINLRRLNTVNNLSRLYRDHSYNGTLFCRRSTLAIAQSVQTTLIVPRFAVGRKLRFTSVTSHLYGSNNLVHQTDNNVSPAISLRFLHQFYPQKHFGYLTKCFEYANRSSLWSGAKAPIHFGHEPSVWLEQPRSPLLFVSV